jgi:xylulose-5-phosphate/fructose-6-phosphate phosphoketolase
VRAYFPPDANTLLVVADRCLRSTDCVNVIVADKQKHLQFTTIEQAVVHCTKGIGIWAEASTDAGVEPDVVLASCGDVATQEALAAAAILREHLPDLKLRFVNVVDLFKMQPITEHPHGSTAAEFDSLFTIDKPIIFNYHGYPWLIHKLSYRFRNHDNLHVRGYKEKGNINTPLELAILNNTDRFDLVIDVIDRVPRLQITAAHLKERMKNAILDAAALSFLGLGAQPPQAEWGSMLGTERNSVFNYPHLVFIPGLMIMLTVLSFNLLGDGLRDALDPRQKVHIPKGRLAQWRARFSKSGT